MTRRVLFSCLFLLLGFPALASPAFARSLAIEEFEADVRVETSGLVRVEERIRVRFDGSWNGIFRWIPYGYTYPNGLRGMIQLRLDAVEDEAGNELEHWTKRSSGRLSIKIKVPGAEDATRTVVLRYHARDVVRLEREKDEEYGAYDQFYWNITGNDWMAPIEHAVATVTLPNSIPEKELRAGAFVGLYGWEGEEWVAERTGPHAFRIETTQRLAPGAGLTVLVTFPPGHVAKPAFLERLVWWGLANWHALLPLLAAALWLLFWWRWGRDRFGDRAVVPDWRAPAGLRPTEMGVLADHSLDQRDITAAIVDLAVRGVLTIRETDDDWTLELVPGGREEADLSPFEEDLLDGLFPGEGTSVEMKDLKHEFYKKMPAIRRRVLDGLVEKDLYRTRPDDALGKWVLLSLIVIGVLFVIGVNADATWLFWVTFVPSAIALLVIANAMPQRTAKGLDALARVRGVEDYIRTAETQRLKSLPGGHFDRVLPMAIALGLSDRWARAFEGLIARDPGWYRSGASGLGSRGIVHGLDGMNRNVRRTLLATPRSSKSGGSWGGKGGGGGGGGGGGFSGGGFGGGGGGGW